MSLSTQKLTIENAEGIPLSARLDMPSGPPVAYAMFAHCFTCTKDNHATRRISAALTAHGIAVLRFDFTGLGESDGDFSSTSFSSNVEDLLIVANWMRDNHKAPALLIGHSFGGAAVLTVAEHIEEAKAIVTIAAPADTTHLTRHIADALPAIQREGVGEVSLGGQSFRIGKTLIEDLSSDRVTNAARKLNRALLIMHAPFDSIVSIDNASALFRAAKHPKSFISLDGADHLLSKNEDATYVANVIAAWASRYLPAPTQQMSEEDGAIWVRETGHSKYQNKAAARQHVVTIDEPMHLGGGDTGPTPTEFVSVALGACTSITLRMYADRKEWPVDALAVKVTQSKNDDGKTSFYRSIQINGALEDEQRLRMIDIANKCPVHKILEQGAHIETEEIKGNFDD